MASVRKKHNSKGYFYEIRVRLGRDKPELTKRWYVPDGWSQKTIDRELARQTVAFEDECKKGLHISRNEQKVLEEHRAKEIESAMTVKKYGSDVFLPAKQVYCSPNTIDTFERVCRVTIFPSIGDMLMADVTTAHLSKLLLDYQSTGRSHASCVKLYTVMNLLFSMAYMTDVIERNPMDKVSRPKPRKDEMKNTEVESYTADEISYIMECLEGEDIQWQAYVRLMIDTGMRRGECCGLKWDRVDFDRNTIHISETLNYTAKDGVFVGRPKNGKERVVDVDPSVMELLMKLRNSKEVESEWVFTQSNSAEPMHPQTPTGYMRDFQSRYGVAGMHPHKLRHSFASIAITAGADIASVSEILGHSDKAVTLRVYSHSDAEARKRASDTFRNAIKEKK